MNPTRSVTLPEVFAENTAWLRRLALTLVRDQAQADDVLQETWLEWLRRPPRAAASPRGWLRAVLRNLARKERRAEERRRKRELAAARAEPLAADPGSIVERVELHRQVLSHVVELDEPYRSVILLRFFEDLRPADIARRQEVPLTTVYSRIHKASSSVRTLR